jgi:hypothetical protein
MLLLCLSIESAFSQSYQVGIIDYYGTKYPNANFESCLTFKEKDTIRFLTDSITYVKAKRQIVDCLLEKRLIKQADIKFVCCDQVEGKWIAYIGTSDKPKSINNKDSKTKDLKLPIEITNAYDSLMNFLLEAIQSGQSAEDDSEGHAFFVHPPSHKIQERFKIYADIYLQLLKEVIKSSKYPYQRTVASTVIAYYHDKRNIVNDLVEAAKDDDDVVRNAAIRALGIILNYSTKRPNLKISIPPDPFILLMNSISWTDRNKSVSILLTMSNHRDPKFLLQLKNTILESLIDMARWKSEGHAMSGFIILGRMAGWTEKKIFESLKKDRSRMIDEMLTQIK